jgi:5-methylcytosine-specific restriction endonuclease McrA
LANVRKNNTKRRAAAAAEVRSYLETHACVDCGETNPRLLEFDHVRDKSYEISYLVRMGASKKQIAAEIEKCEVRCANCHRRKTAERGDWYRVVMA